MGFRSSEILADAHNFMAATGEDIQHAMAREAILFSAIFTEAFMNDLTAWLPIRRGALVEGEDDGLIALAELLPQFEADRLQIKLKYQLAFYILNLRRLSTGEEPFQSFALLTELRNRLVHAHTPIFPQNPEVSAVPQQQKLMDRMKSLGAIGKEDTDQVADWTVAARSRKCPPWAFKSAVNIVKLIIESISRADLRNELKVSVFSGHYNEV